MIADTSSTEKCGSLFKYYGNPGHIVELNSGHSCMLVLSSKTFIKYILVIWSLGSKRCNRRVKIAICVLFRPHHVSGRPQLDTLSAHRICPSPHVIPACCDCVLLQNVDHGWAWMSSVLLPVCRCPQHHVARWHLLVVVAMSHSSLHTKRDVKNVTSNWFYISSCQRTEQLVLQ